MSPRALMQRIKQLNIEWIAITDHNTLANCTAYAKVAENEGIAFTYGVEIQTMEEIHLLAYFDDKVNAMEFDQLLYTALPDIKNDTDFFGDQPIIDEHENIIRLEQRALSNSVCWDLEATVDKVKNFGGFCVPAHIDAEANSILGQIGFIPDNLDFPLLGITSMLDLDQFKDLHPELRQHSFLRASDAHYITDLGCGLSQIKVMQPSVAELVMAARQQSYRIILV